MDEKNLDSLGNEQAPAWRSRLIKIFIILILFSFVIISLLIYLKQSHKEHPNISPVLKTYNNPSWGISFEYNSSLRLDEIANDKRALQLSTPIKDEVVNNQTYQTAGEIYAIDVLNDPSGFKTATEGGTLAHDTRFIPSNIKVPKTFDLYLYTYTTGQEVNPGGYSVAIINFIPHDTTEYGYTISCNSFSKKIENCAREIRQILQTLTIAPHKNTDIIDTSDISSWKTYADSEGHYTLRYPPLAQANHGAISSTQETPYSQQFALSVQVSPNIKNQTVESIFQDYYNSANYAPAYSDVQTMRHSLQLMAASKKTYVNGKIEGISFHQYMQDDVRYSDAVLMVKNNMIYYFTMELPDAFHKELFNKILSTFDFTSN